MGMRKLWAGGGGCFSARQREKTQYFGVTFLAVRFLKGQHHKITTLRLFFFKRESHENTIFRLSWRVGGTIWGWMSLPVSVYVSVGYARVRYVEVAALLFGWLPLGVPRGVR